MAAPEPAPEPVPEPVPEPTPEPAAKTPEPETVTVTPPPAEVPPNTPLQPQKPVIQYVEREPSLSSLRVKAEKENQLYKAETYWRKRFAKQDREVCILESE